MDQEGPPTTVEEPAPSFIVDADSCFTLHAALRKEMEKINEILEVVQEETKPSYALVEEFKTVMDLLGDAREATMSSQMRASTGTNAVRSLCVSLCVSFFWMDRLNGMELGSGRNPTCLQEWLRLCLHLRWRPRMPKAPRAPSDRAWAS